MGKKKTTKVKRQWKNICQVTKMGDEIGLNDIETNSVYSVLMITKGDGEPEYRWGIVITDGDGCVVRNWNMNARDAWDANHLTWRSGWRIFRADVLSETFARTYAKVLVTMKELKDVKYKHEHMSLWDRIMGR